MTEVVDVSIDRQRSITITFDDGVIGEFDLPGLRGACPCAGCRGQREQGRLAWEPSAGATPLTITDADLVGAWGLAIRWSDGHDTGIFAWDLLRRWMDAESGEESSS